MSLCSVLLKPSHQCNISVVQKCFFSSSGVWCNKMREARFLNKMMGQSSKKKRAWKPAVFSGTNTMGDMVRPSVGKQHLQRLNVLNTLFMEHITDFMSGSDIFEKVAGYNLEISEIKIATDLNFLNVYWSSTSTEDPTTIAALLEETAYPLRHELSKLNLLGNVPRIIFVRDVKNQNLNEVDRLLKVADYGEDFAPTNPTLFLDREFPKSSENEENIDVTEEEEQNAETRLLESRQAEVNQLMALQKHSVFGLDQLSIMNRIKSSLHKSKALHRQKVALDESVVEANREEDLASVVERIEAIKSQDLKDFLTKRKKSILKDKRVIERELSRAPEYKMFEADSEDRLRNEFSEDSTNYDYMHSSEEYR